MKRFRVYENHSSSIGIVENLLIVVYTIENNEVCFFLNPSLEDYTATENSQSMELRAIDDTRLMRMDPASGPERVELLGTPYDISVDCIGTVSFEGRGRNYCDFVINEAGNGG